MTALSNPEPVDWAALLWECFWELVETGEIPFD